MLASPRGFCAGVERAIDVVEQAIARYGKPIYVRHEIVHNSHVIDGLTQKGAIFVESLAEVPENSWLIYSAHGVSPKVREEAQALKLRVIDATCPLVTKVHNEAKKYAAEGYTIILVGHKGHVELEGTSGEAPEATKIIETVEDAEGVQVPDPNKVVCLTQTTLSVDDTKKVVDTLKGRFPAMIQPAKDDICYATQNRQNAVKELVKEAELVLVVGSKASSNSNRLVDVARSTGARAYLINDWKEIKPEWLEGVQTVGLTAGASAPEHLVTEAIEHLKKQGINEVKQLTTITEKVFFPLPKI